MNTTIEQCSVRKVNPHQLRALLRKAGVDSSNMDHAEMRRVYSLHYGQMCQVRKVLSKAS